MSAVRVCAMLVMVSFLVACSASKGRCYKVREYQSAVSAQEIVVPEGLVPLNESDPLQIPEGSLNKTATPEGQPCLDYPPRYFRDVSPAAGDAKNSKDVVDKDEKEASDE